MALKSESVRRAAVVWRLKAGLISGVRGQDGLPAWRRLKQELGQPVVLVILLGGLYLQGGSNKVASVITVCSTLFNFQC